MFYTSHSPLAFICFTKKRVMLKDMTKQSLMGKGRKKKRERRWQNEWGADDWGRLDGPGQNELWYINRGFRTRMVYLDYYITCLRYTILVQNPRNWLFRETLYLHFIHVGCNVWMTLLLFWKKEGLFLDLQAVKLNRQAVLQDGAPSPKLSPRTLRRRGIHEDPLCVKVEETSDPEIEFSPPASTSTANNGPAAPTWSQNMPPAPLLDALAPLNHLYRRKEDLTDCILTWQILPSDVKQQMPVMPSHVYGIHHLLRLFGK